MSVISLCCDLSWAETQAREVMHVMHDDRSCTYV